MHHFDGGLLSFLKGTDTLDYELTISIFASLFFHFRSQADFKEMPEEFHAIELHLTS
jgi:hypothetical protein